MSKTTDEIMREVFIKHVGFSPSIMHLSAMNEYTSQQLAEKEKEIHRQKRRVEEYWKQIEIDTAKINSQQSTIQSLKEEVEGLKEARDEREELIKAFDAIRSEFEGRKWLMEGRGNYTYDDEGYKLEVRYIMDAFNEINDNLWRKIKSKTFEYRQAIEKPLQSTITTQAEEIKELEKINDKSSEIFSKHIADQDQIIFDQSEEIKKLREGLYKVRAEFVNIMNEDEDSDFSDIGYHAKEGISLVESLITPKEESKEGEKG